MSRFARLKNRLVAKIATRFPSLSRLLVEAYRPLESAEEVPWSPLRKPLAQSRVAVVTTAGVHHRSQPPFDMQDPDGDPSFRVLRAERIGEDYRITYDYYDHTDAEKDLNIVLPLDRLREFGVEGIIGGLADTHYGFMGHIDGRQIPILIEKSAREVAGRLKASRVDVVLLTPA